MAPPARPPDPAPRSWGRVGLDVVLGPLGLPTWTGRLLALTITACLTVLTQVGGVVLWPVWTGLFAVTQGRTFGRRWLSRLAGLSAAYLIGCFGLLPLLTHPTGRVPLPWRATEAVPLGPLWWGTVLLNRHYVRPFVRESLVGASQQVGREHSGSVVRYLDAGFPFPFPPLLPHLSHGTGEKVDLAFFFADAEGPVDQALSPIGYWGYAQESPERTECAGVRQRVGPLSLDLRWDLPWLQPLWPDLSLDEPRNRTLVRALESEPQLCSILLEPTLHGLFGGRRVRANPCAVARHDDHLHASFRARCP